MMKLIRIGIIICGLSIGFFSKVVGQTLDISKSATEFKDSLVHVAYGTVLKKDLSGAISVINPSEYLDKSYGTSALEGVGAFIGGSNLWNLGTELVLVDGVPDSISNVTTTEIEQITYLKGANAVVLYGSRAANGVILITTKRGEVGDLVKKIRVNTGINKPKSYPNYLGSAEYMTYYNQACANDGITTGTFDQTTIDNYASHSNIYLYPDVNYYSSDYLRKFYNTYSANAEFSGGTERARFYVLLGWQNQNSLLNFGEGKKDYTSRLNVRGNIDFKLNEFIKSYVNISTVFNDSRSPLGNYWSGSTTMHPNYIAPLIPISMISSSATTAQTYIANSANIIDGTYLLGGSQQYTTNPIGDVYASGFQKNTSRVFRYTAGLDVDLKKISKGLSLHGQMSIDYTNSYKDSVAYTYASYASAWNTGGDTITGLTKYNTDARDGVHYLGNTWNDQITDFNVHLDYINTINQLHNVSAMLVGSGTMRRQTGDYQYQTNSNLGIQLDYNYAHKYYADISGAIVNSTKLSSKKRIAFSPTMSIGWLMSSEDFLEDSKVVNRLKVSASASIVNTDLDLSDYYLYDGRYYSSYYYGWQEGNYSNQASTSYRTSNSNLSYAKRKELNFSIDGGLLNNLLNIQATAFFIKKDGIPVQATSQYPSYFSTYYPTSSFVPYINFGVNQYRGFDVQLNYREKLGEVNMIVGATGTYETTKALKVDEYYADSYRNRAGKSVDAIFGLQSEGLFADDDEIADHASQEFSTVKPGDIKYKDQNGDGIINERDEVKIGQWSSPFQCGLNVTLQWKNFTLFALGTGQFGGTGVKTGSYYWVYGSLKYSEVVRNSWTEATKNTATYPELTTLSNSNNFRYSSFWTYSTDRFNISKVQLTYALPEKILNRSFIKNVDVYISGNDLLMISKNRKIMELNVGTTPQTCFYNLGIKAEF
jgi:TonB-linked SusC/RagA family outer membrane protein